MNGDGGPSSAMCFYIAYVCGVNDITLIVQKIKLQNKTTDLKITISRNKVRIMITITN